MKATPGPHIRKVGTIDCDMVETTPVVFRGKLYRFEYVRQNYKPNLLGRPHFRFVEIGPGQAGQPFAPGHHLGSAHAERDTVFVYGVDRWGASEIRVFWSNDLDEWQSRTALGLRGYGIYNNSVCKGKDRYIMAIELGEPPEVVGVRFTIVFAESDDLLEWRLLPLDRIFSKDRYTACPTIRFYSGHFYLAYLEEKLGPTYETYIVRSDDLVTWESTPLNPFMKFSEDDRKLANESLSPVQRRRIASAVDVNNSDVDLCEFEDTTYICYSWGDQRGTEFLAEAVYDGRLSDMLEAFFP